MDELVAFVRRCLDDDERSINDDREIGESPTFPYRQLLDDIKAKRRILDRFGSWLHVDDEYDSVETTLRGEAEEMLPEIAQPYAGRDGWREEWQLSPDT